MDIGECDVCGDTTGTHKQFCGEGSGRDDTRAVIVEAAGIDPDHADNDCYVHATGGNCQAIIALLGDGRELWVTNIGGTMTGPDRDDEKDGWLVGLYRDHGEDVETASFGQTTDQTLDGLRKLIERMYR